MIGPLTSAFCPRPLVSIITLASWSLNQVFTCGIRVTRHSSACSVRCKQTKKTITQNKTNTQAKNCLPLKIKVKTNSPRRCVADSIKVALGVGKLLFGFHSSKSLHYSICPNDQLPKQPFFDLAVYDSEALGTKLQIFHDPIVSKRLEHKENQTKYRNMTGSPRSHVRI